MGVNRPAQLKHPSHAFSMERSARPRAWQANLTRSQSRTGDHYNSTSRSVAPVSFSPRKYSGHSYLEFLPAARFSTYRSRRTCPHLSVTGRSIRPGYRRSEPASHGTHSSASACTRPPSQALLVRRCHWWLNQEQKACSVVPGPRNPSRYVFLPTPFSAAVKVEVPSWLGRPRYHGTWC